MKKGTGKIILIILLLVIAVVGSSIYSSQIDLKEDKESETTESEAVTKTETKGSKHLRDKGLLYDDGNKVVTMYLTVSRGNASEGTDHTWEEINTYSAYYYDEREIDRYKVEALLQVGTEDGVPAGNLGYGVTVPNAIVQIRGQTSSRNDQKNYKIELKENQGSWNGQTTIALNKHMTDGLRYRNKMGFDLLAGIDELMSLRTQFVHLYVNDLTDGADDGFEDYGLYTQVEQLNKTALKAHGLDKTGHLYKINFFEFFRYEDVIKLSTDSTYNQDEFEKYLEIKGNTDHSKLIALLEDVNDYGMPIEDVIDKHFDMENLVYWMAFNILTGNVDTQSRNTYLYSPQNQDTWYLYCWDLDAFFRKTENEIVGNQDAGSWDQGVSNYWGNALFCRCLKSDTFRAELDKAITELRSYLSYGRLLEMTQEYDKVVRPYVYSEPDITFAPLTPENYDIVEENLPFLVEDYYEKYVESLEKPMPFYIGTPTKTDQGMTYNWDASYDFDQEDITYKAVVARDMECTDIVCKYEGNWISFEGDYLPEGQYFLRVTATNESGYTQDAFDYYETENGKEYGRLCFYVDASGNITRYTVVE